MTTEPESRLAEVQRRLEVADRALDEIFEIVKTYDQSPTVAARVLAILEALP